MHRSRKTGDASRSIENGNWSFDGSERIPKVRGHDGGSTAKFPRKASSALFHIHQLLIPFPVIFLEVDGKNDYHKQV